MVETREMETIEEVLLYVKLLVGLKHLIMVCKVAVLLQTLLGCLRTLLQASTTSGTGDPRKYTLVCKSYLSSQGWGSFPLHFMNEFWILRSKASGKEVRYLVLRRKLKRGEWGEMNFSDVLTRQGTSSYFCAILFWVFFGFYFDMKTGVAQTSLTDKTVS